MALTWQRAKQEHESSIIVEVARHMARLWNRRLAFAGFRSAFAERTLPAAVRQHAIYNATPRRAPCVARDEERWRSNVACDCETETLASYHPRSSLFISINLCCLNHKESGNFVRISFSNFSACFTLSTSTPLIVFTSQPLAQPAFAAGLVDSSSLMTTFAPAASPQHPPPRSPVENPTFFTVNSTFLDSPLGPRKSTTRGPLSQALSPPPPACCPSSSRPSSLLLLKLKKLPSLGLWLWLCPWWGVPETSAMASWAASAIALATSLTFVKKPDGSRASKAE
mmetsp:Transcript_62215/g.131493  ORF Transcript_62215/g.131493 Transcript_62215/m.131493 type:complete len:282 (-) Transcript_62215:191-1036(-)